MAPSVDEDLAHQILGRRLVVDDPHQEAEDPHVVAGEQNLHGVLVALRDQPTRTWSDVSFADRLPARGGAEHRFDCADMTKPRLLCARFRASSCSFSSKRAFRGDFAGAGKWFRGAGELFRAAAADETIGRAGTLAAGKDGSGPGFMRIIFLDIGVSAGAGTAAFGMHRIPDGGSPNTIL